MKIIKEGSIENTKKVTCTKCRTEFEWERNDVRHKNDYDGLDIGYVVCPICHYKIQVSGRGYDPHLNESLFKRIFNL